MFVEKKRGGFGGNKGTSCDLVCFEVVQAHELPLTSLINRKLFHF
jgi:hypothetical protein